MQLTIALAATLAAALAAAPGVARAQSTFETKLQVYTDDDHTQVVSPVVQAHAELDEHTSVNAGYLVDAVTSASIDVVSQASPRTIHDTRHQVSLGGSHLFESVTARLNYTFSTENDYRSHSLGGGVERTLFGKNTTLGLSYGVALNTVGRVDDHNFAADLTVHHASLTWTQVINRRFTSQVGYDLSLASGLQSSPYRFVPLRMSPDAAPELWVPETDPESRVRHAIVVGANWFVPHDSALQADYRLYRDTWGITSHTIGLRWFTNLTEDLELRVRSRLYSQGGASFYRPNYAQLEKYMTVDRELSALWSETLGAKLMWKLSERLEVEGKVDGFYYHYADFPALTSRLGLNAGAGLQLTY